MVKVRIENDNGISVITIERPQVRNAVDRETAEQLANAFRTFERDPGLDVAVLLGAGNTFCSGADLAVVANESSIEGHRLDPDFHRDGPMGPTRMLLSKPVIAAISGYAVAGGLELALWCDLRIMEEDAILGVFSRRFGVPLIDGGTQRLPRIIGLGRALDLILTGRPVRAEEAYAMGLVNRVVGHGHALDTAIDLANQLKSFPQAGLRSDRAAVYAGIETSLEDGMIQEFSRGMQVLREGESQEGAQQFVNGIGRHGKF